MDCHPGEWGCGVQIENAFREVEEGADCCLLRLGMEGMNVDVCIVSWKDKERKIKETDIKSNGDDGGEWKETDFSRS